MTVLFHRATAEDAVALCSLVNSGYRGQSSRSGWTTEADLLDGQRIDPGSFLELIEEPGVEVILVRRDGELVGCFELAPDPDGSDDGYVGMITVSPTEQGGGLGSQILAEAERRVSEAGKPAMRMWVIRQREEVIAFYERRGYEVTGDTRPFPYGDERFGVPKRDDLEFVVLRKQLPSAD